MSLCLNTINLLNIINVKIDKDTSMFSIFNSDELESN